MSENLIIFIDSFPYYYLNKTEYLSNVPLKAKLTSGIGYSVNLKAEIFAGLVPDDVGFFCEYAYNPTNVRIGFSNWLLFLMDLMTRNYYIDCILHKLFARFYIPVGQIPFKYLDKFSYAGISVYSEDFPHPTLFNKSKDLKVVLPHTSRFGKKDIEVYYRAKDLITNGAVNIFVAFDDLDGIGHRYGVGSKEYDERVHQLDEWIENLAVEFATRNSQANVICLSDHGMVNVEDRVTLDLERKIGPPSPQTYYYFLDSTLLRVWIFDDTLKEDIEYYLKTVSLGTIVDDETRSRYGITLGKWGDIIFLLNEGCVFSPDFFGKGQSKAMHGFHPELESQKGVFLFLVQSEEIPLHEELRSIDVFSILKKLFRLCEPSGS